MSDSAEFEVLDALPIVSGRGGARPGAGAKPKGHVKSAETVALDKSKARHEQAKAELAELDLKVKTGLYVERAAVRQASATAMSSVAQTLRSVPDNLERRMGIAPEVAEAVGRAIDAALNDLADEFELMTGAPE